MYMKPDAVKPDPLAAIDEVLWRLWDPIGVNDIPEARDEYSSYAAGVLGLLRRGAGDEQIIRHLQAIETERMGLPVSFTRPYHAVASALRAAAQVRATDASTGEP